MSAHTPIIKSILTACNYRTYLELGIYDGLNFQQCSEPMQFAVAVDRTLPNWLRTPLSHRRGFQCTTDDFFSSDILSLPIESRMFDAIFIDACHDIQFVTRDFRNSWRYLTEGGTIFLHDTDPQTKQLIDPGYCGDAWLIHEVLKSEIACNFVTLPCAEAGLTIVKKPYKPRHIA